MILSVDWTAAHGKQRRQPPDLPPQLALLQALNIALTNRTVLREAMAQLDQTSGRYLQSSSLLLPQQGVFARQGIQTISLQGLAINN